MVSGESLATGLNMFSATFFVKEEQAVGAFAPLLMVPLKKCTGLLGGVPWCTLIIESDSYLRRTDGGAA